MAGFIYFRSGDARPIKRDGADKLGLGYAFTGSIEGRPTNSTSPSGKPGLVFADAARQGGKTLGYFPSDQTWRKLPKVEGRPELWVGYWNDAKPGPGDLAREKMLRGPDVILADGNYWKVPIVRHFDSATHQWKSALPAYLDYDENGKIVRGEPLEEYLNLWDVTVPIAEKKLASDSRDSGEEETGPTDEDIITAAGALLQANYVVDIPELIAIRALADNEALATIILVAVRYADLVGWVTQKKTELHLISDGLNTPDGNAA